MDKFNADLQKKYNDLKKRKLIQQVDRNSDSEKKAYQFVSAAEDMLEHEGKKTDHMFEKLLFCHNKLAEKELLELEQTKKMKDLSSEVTRLQDLLSKKNEATINIEMMRRQLPMAKVSEADNASQKEPVNKNEATINIEMMKRQPPTAIVSEEDNASQKEPVNQSCRRCTTDGHGDQVVSDFISDKLVTLIESVHGMKVSFGPQSAEVIHEKSGYAFSLTWSIDGDELVYHVSSLGTLENIASKWMKEEICFSTAMCPKFFQRICSVIGCA
ncbi:hypothetical protein FCM35_KLT09280 [Carex littledalei]|uniref:DUF7806 domain-containing protein n=1 Tax=Carex littledalei TaxID=544730 RepID=A0A833QGQ7_9POAL|nr:hypothetical protein FCM35_KLT09280 [Carex littledalei]